MVCGVWHSVAARFVKRRLAQVAALFLAMTFVLHNAIPTGSGMGTLAAFVANALYLGVLGLQVLTGLGGRVGEMKMT